jgi:hypothetical protein
MRLHWVLVVAAVCVGLVIGAVLSPALIGNAQAATGTASVGVQRYQIVFNPNVRADTFLLDTQTGRVWQSALDTGSGASWWRPIPNPSLLQGPDYFVIVKP